MTMMRWSKTTLRSKVLKINAAVKDRFAKQSSEWFKGWQDLGQSPKVLGDFKYEGNKHK